MLKVIVATLAFAGALALTPVSALPLQPLPDATQDLVLVKGGHGHGHGHAHGHRGRHLGWVIGRHRGWSHSRHRIH